MDESIDFSLLRMTLAKLNEFRIVEQTGPEKKKKTA
jgi:hypothetical protein